MDFVSAAANTVDQWSAKKQMIESVAKSTFAPYMGEDDDAPIQLNYELVSKPGDQLTVSFVRKLDRTSPITGDNAAVNNEHNMANYGHQMTIQQYRFAVVFGKFEAKKSIIDIPKARQKVLHNADADHLKYQIAQAVQSPVNDGVTSYSDSTVTQRNAFAAAQNPSTANQRILYGAAKSNSSATWATALANLDGTADDLSPDIVRLAKRMAIDENTDPHIAPWMLKNGVNIFVMFAGLYPFRDMQGNTDTIHQNAAPRSLEDNPIFAGGNITVDGVTVVQVPDLGVITGAGAGAIDVATNAFCGKQAVTVSFGAEASMEKLQETDYGNRDGRAVAVMRGVERLHDNSLMHGMVMVGTSAVAD